jgi:hypothetical protein
MRLLSTILCWLFVFCSCNKKEKLTEAEVIAVIKSFDESWQAKNLLAVDSVLAPSYIYFTQSGSTFSRSSLVETAGSPEYTLERMERMNLYVRLLENTAVVSTRWQGKGMYKSVPFDEDQRCSITIIKYDGNIKILSEHCTPIKPNRAFH